MPEERVESHEAAGPQTLSATSVVLVVGVRLYREGLAVELGRDPRLDVVGQCGTPAEALAIVGATPPDVILVDIRTPQAFTLLRLLREQSAPVRVVAFAVAEDEDDIERCAEAGVAGFVTQDVSIDDIANAVIAARCGELNCSPRSAALLLRRLATLASRVSASRAPGDVLSQLTAREREILALLATGCSNKAIAGELHIETTTVKNHVHRILEKIGARTRIEAAARVRGMERLPHLNRRVSDR
ncbi:MAG: response regulator transcription factor [Gemmatimonadaceae bacterium]|nr:response regulator transcription factor [Gemmatimonadaceae bacterium]